MKSFEPLEWQGDVDSVAWDRALAALGGHPLQSALWGDARRRIDGIRDHRWMALRAGDPIAMFRIEERKVPLVGIIGWSPRGPTSGAPLGLETLPDELRARLGGLGVKLLVTNPWKKMTGVPNTIARHNAFRSIWIDLGAGQDAVWARLDKGWRYGVRHAGRLGVEVLGTQASGDVEKFFALCMNLSQVKGFDLPGSLPLLLDLLRSEGGNVEAKLFVARCDGELAAGAVVFRCGASLHYFWGATDRRFRKECPGEAVQWGAIEWAIAKGCKLYDLEGIDPKANPGTFAFKKKMGGAEVDLCGKEYFPVGMLGYPLAWLDALRSKQGFVQSMICQLGSFRT